MKRAFTTMELIFVIIILGLLAAFAILRLATSRDDADFVQILSNTKQLMIDIMSYNASQGGIDSDIKKMTNVQNVSFSGSVTLNNIIYPNFLYFNARDCVLKFVFTYDANNHVIIKLDPSMVVDDCKVLARNNAFEHLRNSEYPVGSKVNW